MKELMWNQANDEINIADATEVACQFTWIRNEW